MATRSHRADEHVLVGRVILHSNAVAEYRAPSEGGTGIHAQYANLIKGIVTVKGPAVERERDQSVGQGRLAATRRSGDAHYVGRAPFVGERGGLELRRATGLDVRQQARERRARTITREFE